MRLPGFIRSPHIVLAGVLAAVVVLSVIFFLGQLNYSSCQDPWGCLFASRQYARYGILWQDPVVKAMTLLQKSGPFPDGFLFFNGDYQW